MRKIVLKFLLVSSCFAGESSFLGEEKFVRPGVGDAVDFVREARKESVVDGDEFYLHPEYLKMVPEREKKWINFATDICWKAISPIRAMGVCYCNALHWGVAVSFWEPMMIIEVTATPYKMPLFGGARLGGKESYKHWGALSQSTDSGRTSFYNVHYYSAPLFRTAGLFPGLTCLNKKSDYLLPSPVWMSEWDPTWKNPELARIFSPQMQAFANPKALAACAEDCRASMKGEPNDALFWCSGCLGAYYPFTGHVAHHLSGAQASSLLVHRFLGRHHFIRSFFKLGTGFEKGEYCKQKVFAHLQKSHYKTQLIYPVPDQEGIKKEDGSTLYGRSLGASVANWEAGKSYPDGGEDFVYIFWTKMNCCLDVPDLAKRFIPGGRQAEEAVGAADTTVEKAAEEEGLKAAEEMKKKIEEWAEEEFEQEAA